MTTILPPTSSGTPPPPLCPQCSAPLPPDAPLGLCPACLIKRGFNSTAAATEVDKGTPAPHQSGSSLPDSMSMEQLAPFFPNLELIELLGRGGMGVVYKARQKHLDRQVALKILPTELYISPAFAERFSREAKALARLSHPRIVTIYDFGRAHPAGMDPNSPTTPTLYYLLMEYVDGSNLRHLIKSLSPEQGLAIVPQICEALQFAHDEGVVHRDIKPENILVDKKGRVKIADFGLAKLLEHATGPADYTLTHPDRILGTLHYMAPEQLERPTEVDHRADIYSLGVVFYELLTGHLPLGRFALPSETRSVDARLDEVVLKALEREPEKRYQHASEVGTSVEAVRKTPAPQPAMSAAAAPVTGVAAAPISPAPPETVLREKEDASAKPATPPQLSRNAIAGAICGVVALLAGIMAGVADSNIQRQYYFDEHAGLFHEGPNWAVALWCIGLVLAGIGAVVMPLLGAIGMAQIRRAPEKLYGLRLALFDALLVPLLILDGLVAAGFGAVYFMDFREAKAVPVSPAVHPESLSVAPLILGLGIWLPVIDALIYWLIWRKLRIKNTPDPAVKKDAGPRLSRMAVLAPLCGAPAIVGMIFIISAVFSLHPMADDFGNSYWGPLWAQDELIWGLITVGLFGGAMSLVGAIAVAQIRRSAEKLYGLRLALFEALLFPLLLVDSTVVGFLGGYRPVLLLALSVLALGSSVFIYWQLWKRLRVPARDPSPFQSSGTQPLTTTASPVTSPLPSVANPLPTAAISQIPIAREPKHFYVYAFALYCVCWVIPLLLWNLAWPGFILSVGIFATVAWLQARYLQKFRPEIVAARAAEPQWMKAMRPSKLNLSFTLAFVLLFLSLALQHDSTLNPDIANMFGSGSQTLADTSRDFLKGFQSDDTKRLSADVRDLSLRDTIATSPNWITGSSGNTEGPPMATLFRPTHSSISQELGITTSILLYPSAVPPEFRQISFFSFFIPLGLYFFMVGFVDMLSSKGYKFSGLAWKPALALTGLLVASFLLVGFASTIVFNTVRSDRFKQGKFPQFQMTMPIQANSAQAAENLFPTLDRWALKNGYEIAAFTDEKLNDSHRLPEMPMHVTYRAAVLWKPGLFDRLGIDWDGIYGRAPEILVQAANTDDYSEIAVTTSIFGGGNYASSVASNGIQKDLQNTLEKTLTTTQPAESGIGMHGTKSVAPTADELSHILAELPKPFTQDLTGSTEEQIKALGTKVWAFDFDQGPASFWIAAHEEGQKTFPERIPEAGLGVVWRVEKPRAHILMWLQPREEAVEMSAPVLSSARKRSAELPDYALGIDVDGKSVVRDTYNPGLSKPQIPLWFGWVNRELQESSGAIDLDIKTGVLRSRNQAMVFIRATKTPDGTPVGKQVPPAASVEFGLWYLPDNAPPLLNPLPPSDKAAQAVIGFWRSLQPVTMPGKEPALQTLWFAPDGTAKVGIVQHTKNGQFAGNNIAFTRPDGTPDETVAFWLFADHLAFIPANSDPRQPVVPLIYFNRLPVSAKETAINGYWRGLPARTGAPARLGDGAVTLYFDPQAVATESQDVDLPALAMKYSVQRGDEASHIKLNYKIGNGPAMLAEASTNSAATELTLPHFSPNGGEATTYKRDTLGIDAAPEYSATPLKPGERPKSDRQRFFDIGRYIIGVYTSPGSAAEGEQMAGEALRLAEKLPDEPLTPDALNQAHTVLGLAALKKGDLVAAKSHLLQSISDRPSSSLDSSGPQLMLAGALLARGERQTVLDFLDQCARYYPGTKEHMQRRREIISAGHTPDDLVYKDPSAPLFGRWISVKPILYTLAIVTFNPDGTATYAQGYRLHGSYQITDGKLSVTDEPTKTVSDMGPFTITQDKLTFANMNNDANKYSADTDGKPIVFERVGKGTGLVGTWVGKSRLLDAGPSEFTMTYGADGSVTLKEEIAMANFQYRYYLDGKKLYFSQTREGKTTDSTGAAVFDKDHKDQLVLNGFPILGIGDAPFKRDEPPVASTMPRSPQSR